MNSGSRLRELREARGLTQGQVAAMLGYRTHSPVRKMEAGDLALKDRHLKILAREFHVTPGEILGIADTTREKNIPNGDISEGSQPPLDDSVTGDIVDPLKSEDAMNQQLIVQLLRELVAQQKEATRLLAELVSKSSPKAEKPTDLKKAS